MSKSRRVIFLALSGIGNWLMQSPTVEALRRSWPNAYIAVAVAGRGAQPLVETHRAVNSVIELSLKTSLGQHLNQIQRLRREHFDVGVVLSPGQQWKSAVYLRLSGVPVRIGESYPWRGNQHSHFLLTQAIDENESLHDIEQNLRLLGLLGIRNQESPNFAKASLGERIKEYTLKIPKQYQEQGELLFSQLKLPQGKILIGFHLGSAPDFSWKRWPAERFVAVGKALVEKHNAHILLFGGPDETALNEAAAREIGAASVIKTDLLTTAAVMQHCRLFLSNDSGLMHIAAAVGIPTIGLFGPTDERNTGPRGKNSQVLRAPGTQPAYHTEKNYHLGSAPHETMLMITSRQVLSAAVGLMKDAV